MPREKHFILKEKIRTANVVKTETNFAKDTVTLGNNLLQGLYE